MIDQQLTVSIAKSLEDLIPAYIKNRLKELESLRLALAADDVGVRIGYK